MTGASARGRRVALDRATQRYSGLDIAWTTVVDHAGVIIASSQPRVHVTQVPLPARLPTAEPQPSSIAMDETKGVSTFSRNLLHQGRVVGAIHGEVRIEALIAERWSVLTTLILTNAALALALAAIGYVMVRWMSCARGAHRGKPPPCSSSRSASDTQLCHGRARVCCYRLKPISRQQHREANDAAKDITMTPNSRVALRLILVSTVAAMLIAGRSQTATAGEAGVTAVKVTREAAGTYRFDVTVRHADTGWKHYADRWDIVGPDGTVLGARTLYHPHVNEQPFTRSLSGVRIPDDVATVTVRAHDKVHGLGGKTVEVAIGR